MHDGRYSRPSSQKKGFKITWPPHDPEKLATHPATLVHDPCATPARVVRESVPSISGMVLKHFAILSLKMMLRSLPEVVRSSKNDETFDHGTCFCLTFAVGAQSCRGAAGEPRSRLGGSRPETEQNSPGAKQERPGTGELRGSRGAQARRTAAELRSSRSAKEQSRRAYEHSRRAKEEHRRRA